MVISLCVCAKRRVFDELWMCVVWNTSQEMSLEVILMSLMSLGVISLCACEEKGCV